MGAAAKFPITIYELADLGPGIHHFPGTEAEYWELIEASEYYAEFQNNEIIAMSYDTNPHSRISTSFIRILANIFWDSEKFIPHNGNRPVYVEATGAIYNPDALVVSEPVQFYQYRPGMNAEMTPVIIVEVLSKNTREHDINDKLPAYKTIPSMKMILLVESTLPKITVFSKDESSGLWSDTVYDKVEASIKIGGQEVTLKEIYKKIVFDQVEE